MKGRKKTADKEDCMRWKDCVKTDRLTEKKGKRRKEKQYGTVLKKTKDDKGKVIGRTGRQI